MQTHTSDGIVRRQPDVTILDTRSLDWQPHPGIPGGLWKVLACDGAGTPLVMLNWLPPDLKPRGPKRHYHRTVLEHGFVLCGELAMREYDSLDDQRGAPVRFRDGYFYRRQPGSVHGLDPLVDDLPGIGFLILEWRTGPGTYMWEDGVEAETTETTLAHPLVDDRPPLPPDPRGVVVERDDLIILDTRTMSWEEHPWIDRAAIKVLARDPAGTPLVTLEWLPSDLPLVADRHRHPPVTERGFVLEGVWAHREYENLEDQAGEPVDFLRGFFYERRPGSVHGVDSRAIGRGAGALILKWRSGPGDDPAPGDDRKTVRHDLGGSADQVRGRR